MKYCSAAMLAAFLLLPAGMFGSAELKSPDITVGKNLQTTATITLPEAAPKGGLEISVTSDNPELLLLSTVPERAGSASITVRVPEGRQTSREFYVQGLADRGTATYSVNAPGFSGSTAKVTLAPAGFAMKTPAKLGADSFSTTAGPFGRVKIYVYSVMLDPSFNFVAEQPVAGGQTLSINVTSSNNAVGILSESLITIAGGFSAATTYFQPAAPGNTTLALNVPNGFLAAPKLGTVNAVVKAPGIAITDDITVGENLQCPGVISLGQPAPQGGLTLTLTSNNPAQLLLSNSATVLGSKSITITVPAGAIRTGYQLQALSGSGAPTYTVTAPGYNSRTATIQLAPSGVLIGYRQPPDETELARKESAERLHGFVTNLSAQNLQFTLYTAQLDPQTHRGADITVQPLRPGVSVTVNLKSSNPSVGTVVSPVTISSGSSASADFKPLSAGTTVVSIDTPQGFMTPGNATAFEAIVRQ